MRGRRQTVPARRAAWNLGLVARYTDREGWSIVRWVAGYRRLHAVETFNLAIGLRPAITGLLHGNPELLANLAPQPQSQMSLPGYRLRSAMKPAGSRSTHWAEDEADRDWWLTTYRVA